MFLDLKGTDRSIDRYIHTYIHIHTKGIDTTLYRHEILHIVYETEQKQNQKNNPLHFITR